ncbi:MAG: hypothetical protein K0S33_1571 [Bacteroidetes bacterium]|nr:hypothetical protein [Bacteroidota bacterium]
MSKTVYIIGGGASGFFCAINMAQKHSDYRITILEKTTKLLSKVLVSGGGRCNTTHHCFDNNELVRNYPRGIKELKGVFARFSVKDTIQWFEERGVKLYAEPDGRMFPDTNSSQTIIDCFMQEAKSSGVKILCKADVHSIKKENNKFQLQVHLDNAAEPNILEADVVVVATGGFPMKKGYDFLLSSGHSIVNPIPSLYTFNIPANAITQLMGVALKEVNVKITGTSFAYSGPFLITHWGFSGPAVLKLSAFAADHFHEKNYTAEVMINWLNAVQEEVRTHLQREILLTKRSLPKNTNVFNLPKRLWEFLLQKAEIDSSVSWEETPRKKINRLIELLSADIYKMQGKTTFKEEFVTCGGIPLQEVDCKRMESKKIPNLFFAGEVLNIDGITGGFNFQAAWSTAWIVADSVA